MHIENLKIKGFGPFVTEYDISFQELDEIVAVTGRNGVGKTFLLECIPGALYGYFPFRMFKQQGISIYDMLPDDKLTLSGSLEMVFSIGGRRFRIERSIEIRGSWKGNSFEESSKNQNVIIGEWDGQKWDPKAEKSKAVFEYVEKEICPQSLFLASAFNSQNSAGDIVDCGADERKKIFANIIGLGDLTAKADLFKARAAFTDKMVGDNDILANAERGRIVDNEQIEEKKKQFNENIAFWTQDKADLEQSHEILLQQKAKYDTLEKDIQRLKDGIAETNGSIALKGHEVERLQKMIAVKGAITVKHVELKNERAQCETLDKTIEERTAQLAGMQKLKDRVIEISVLEGDALSEIKTKINKLLRDKSTYQNQLSKQTAVIKEWHSHEDAAAILDSLDCPANCKYVANAQFAKNWIEENPLEPELLKLAEMNASMEKVVAEIEEAEKQIQTKQYMKPFQAEMKKIGEEMAVYAPVEHEVIQLKQTVKSSRGRISVLESSEIEKKMALIEMAEKQLPGLKSEMEALNKTLVTLTEEYEKLTEGGIENPALKLRDISQRKGELENKITQAHKGIAEQEQLQKQNQTAAMKASLLTAYGLKLRKLKGSYDGLEKAFGRSGIQALIIDSEKAQFLDIAKELFDILSGGKMALCFQTQKILKNNDVREDFDLLLTVEGKTRKFEQCSMGQQECGRIVMRAALGIYHSIKSGSLIQTYFLDETTGSLDEINRESYYDFLRYLLKYFKQVFVISHQDIVRAIPCRIQITDDHKIVI